MNNNHIKITWTTNKILMLEPSPRPVNQNLGGGTQGWISLKILLK